MWNLETALIHSFAQYRVVIHFKWGVPYGQGSALKGFVLDITL